MIVIVECAACHWRGPDVEPACVDCGASLAVESAVARRKVAEEIGLCK